MEFSQNTLTVLIIFLIIILTFHIIFSIHTYFYLRNKTGPRGPAGPKGPRGPPGRPGRSEDSLSNVKTSYNAGKTIISAWYGSQSNKSMGKDVTQLFKGLISGDSVNITVNNTVFGGDPAPSNPKVLVVKYQENGKVSKQRASENTPFQMNEIIS